MAQVKELSIESHERNQLIKLNDRVATFIAESGVKEGVCYIYVPHTTAGVIINEGADPTVASDLLETLSRLVPHQASYSHQEGNADSHIKSALVGSSATVFVRNAAPVLGTWQSIFFCEFDGPRRRKLWLKLIDG